MTRPTPAERQAMREYHREVAYRGRCVGCGEDWPCRYIRLLDALDDAEQEIARLKAWIAWLEREPGHNIDAMLRYLGYPDLIYQFEARGEHMAQWRHMQAQIDEIAAEGRALVQTNKEKQQ